MATELLLDEDEVKALLDCISQMPEDELPFYVRFGLASEEINDFIKKIKTKNELIEFVYKVISESKILKSNLDTEIEKSKYLQEKIEHIKFMIKNMN